MPNDISVMGFDDIFVASLVEPALSTVRQPIRLMAEAAVDRLVIRLREGADGAQLRTEFLPELVMRSSATTPRQAARVLRGRRHART